MQDPSPECLEAALALLLYLGHTKNQFLNYDGSTKAPLGMRKDEVISKNINENNGFIAYSDSSWHKTDELGFNSFGFILYLFGGPVAFASKSLKVVALSSAEAEYAAASYTCKEIEFIRNICMELGFPLMGRVVLAVDNTAAIQIGENAGVTGRTKHFTDAIHFVRHLIDHGRITMTHVPTDLQRADGFTKPLEKIKFIEWVKDVMCG